MLKTRVLVLSALIVTAVSLFHYTEAGAVADGNGSCSSAEDAASDCGVFGSGNVIEFLGKISPPPSICELCTQYNYKYTGNASNQIKVLIPNTVLTHFPPNSQFA